LKKSSRLLVEVLENCRWWNCSTDTLVEWTFEGSLKKSVGYAGNQTRYQSGSYDSTWREDICQFEWYRDNKNLLPSQALAW